MGCLRHENKCAYSGDEPDRCPLCHSTYDAIAAPHSAASPDTGGGDRAAHEAWHARRDARADRSREARRAARAGPAPKAA
jgi:hypothetical protein